MKISLRTLDNLELKGIWSKIENSNKAILLLHMMPATKESWNTFSLKLNNSNFSTLAIDLRGHGESEGGPDGYKKFSNLEHQNSKLDIEVGLRFLKEQGIELSNIIVIGASIGANLALDALGTHKAIKKAVALSPGLDYKGIIPEKSIKNFSNNQSAFLIASKDDKYSYQSILKLKKIKNAEIKLKEFTDAGHGSNMFNKHPELMDEIISYCDRIGKGN